VISDFRREEGENCAPLGYLRRN